MNADTDLPPPGAGLRHALLLTVVAILPATYALTALGRATIDGFPQVIVLAAAIATALGAALLAVVAPMPRLIEVIGRLAVLALVAMGVRLFVPSWSVALESIQDGEARLFSGAFWLTLLLLGAAYMAGDGITRGVAHLATQARTVTLARDRERRALVIWFWLLLVQLLVVGATETSGGLTASVLLAACALSSLVLLADLRLRTSPPMATRPPVVAAPRQVRVATLVASVLAVVAMTALLTPLVPVETLRTVPSLPAWFADWELAEGQAGELLDILGEDEADEPELPDEPPPDRPDRDWSIPTPPAPLLVAIGALLVLALLRPHRWRRALRRLAAILRGSRWRAIEGGEGTVADLDEVEDDPDEAEREPGRVRRALDRFRPRPRDPREAVLYDYLHVERALARREQARAGYETPHEHAVRIHVSEAHEELADLAADARFARIPPGQRDIERARDLRRGIEQALRSPER